MSTTLIIDGDPVAYLAASYAGSEADARQNAHDKIVKLMRELRAERAIVARSDPSRRYWRHGLFEKYKAASLAKPRPPLIDQAWFGVEAVEHATVKQLPGMEADDLVGILATCGTIKGRTIIVSADKDMLTIPGEHYFRNKPCTISAVEAGFRHLVQTVVGDSGDGYPGCPGVGEKRVNGIIAICAYTRSPAAAWRAVVSAFEDKGLTEDDALLQARLARICHATEYDLATKRVILWTPPTYDGPHPAALPELPAHVPAGTPFEQLPTTRGPLSAEPVPTSLFPTSDGPAEGWPT